MRNYTVAVLVVLALGVSALFATDFWEKKKFSAWNKKEVGRILTDSPWAKSFAVALKGFGGRGGGGGMGGGGGKRGKCGGGGGGIDAGASGGGGGDMGGAAVTTGPTVLMRWQSALPIREAAARVKYGEEAGTSKEAADMLSANQQLYVVGIFGIPAKAVGSATDELKSNAELRVKNQPPARPVQVRISQQGPSTAIFLLFPREQPGAHVIVPADDEVEVFLNLEAGQVSRKFKLKEMMFDGKLEL
jgi:hypothetical protein